jgi:hypothetical protein
MKKLFLMFLTLSLLSVIYASNPKITVVPEECLINSNVYVIYQWKAPYDVEDFRVTVYSDAVDFEDSIILYKGVTKDTEIFHIFKGKAIKPGNYTINVYMKYMYDGAYIKKKYVFNISILPKIQYVEKVKVIEKIIEKNVTSTNTINKTSVKSVNNKTNITTTPIIKKDENKTNTTNIKKTESSGANVAPEMNKELNSIFKDIMYGIAGLVLGVVFGFVTMYVIRT